KWAEAGRMNLLQEGDMINKPSILFGKIDDEFVEQELEKLKASQKLNADKASDMTPQKELINFDDFVKMDIRLGKILEAERVPKADKLLKLLVDTGIDKRTIVSGIAEH